MFKPGDRVFYRYHDFKAYMTLSQDEYGNLWRTRDVVIVSNHANPYGKGGLWDSRFMVLAEIHDSPLFKVLNED